MPSEFTSIHAVRPARNASSCSSIDPSPRNGMFSIRLPFLLTDIVSKNGNLMLNIPLRGVGAIDEHEEAFLAGLTAWMDVNSEGIYATRPWKIHGEGPSLT